MKARNIIQDQKYIERELIKSEEHDDNLCNHCFNSLEDGHCYSCGSDQDGDD